MDFNLDGVTEHVAVQVRRLWRTLHHRIHGARRINVATRDSMSACTPMPLFPPPGGIQLSPLRPKPMALAGGSAAAQLVAPPRPMAMHRCSSGEPRWSGQGSPRPRPAAAPAPPMPPLRSHPLQEAEEQQQRHGQQQHGEPRQRQPPGQSPAKAPPCWAQVSGAQLDAIMRGTAALHLEAHKARTAIAARAARAEEAERRRREEGPSADVAAALAARRAQFEAAAAAQGSWGSGGGGAGAGKAGAYTGVSASERAALLAKARARVAAEAAAVQDPGHEFIQAYYERIADELQAASAGLGPESSTADPEAFWSGFGEEGGEAGGSGGGGEDDDEELPAWA
jgi:hypothetical protein